MYLKKTINRQLRINLGGVGFLFVSMKILTDLPLRDPAPPQPPSRIPRSPLIGIFLTVGRRLDQEHVHMIPIISMCRYIV